MAKRTKLTNSSDETQFHSLISGDTIFTIPYFQRPYKWKSDKLKQLNLDILNIIDDSDSHFFGAIIIHGRRSNPADPNPFDIIDGQQRITTLILYLCAVVKVLSLNKLYDEAAGLFLKYLVIAREIRSPSNLKLYPCKEDRQQFNLVYEDILANKEFVKKLGGFKKKLLPSTGKKRGHVKNNYNSAIRFFKEQVEAEGTERLRKIYEAILESISIVQIDVWDPTNGPKIFDSLNSRQEPMTIGDLVRNEIFSKVASEDEDTIEQIDSQSWQPFYENFQQDNKNLFDAYFFPFGLIKNSNLSKSEVYNSLRESWGHIEEPGVIIKELSEYQNAFIDIQCGTNSQKHEEKVRIRFRKLTSSGMPSSTFPFLMQLSNAIRDKHVTVNDGEGVLNIVESFLVRRAICGHEPTGLHAVFKKLWNDCGGQPTALNVKAAIQKHKTVVCPNDDDFKKAICVRPLYGSAITPYFILEYDLSLKGDKSETIPWTEHVLPVTLSPDWQIDFTEDQHALLKDTLPNLLPLTSEMNIGLSNKGYKQKRLAFQVDSIFKSTREFAKNNNSWKPSDLDKRAKVLAGWGVKRWPW